MDPVALAQQDPDLGRLVAAINHLQGDGPFILRGLIETLEGQSPIVRHRLTEQEREHLIASGEMTAEKLAETEREVDRGALPLDSAESWLRRALDTRSLADTARYMDLTEAETVVAASEGLLYGVEIAGRLRFPVWQMNVGRPDRTVKGLDRIIAAAASAGWDWQHLSAYMDIPQEDLIEEGRLTPLTWLQDIGDVDEIVSLIESSGWH